MNTVEINALGMQCPIPVVKTLKAMDGLTEASLLQVHVDNKTAVENLSRLAAGKSFAYEVKELDEAHFVVEIKAAASNKAEEIQVAPVCAAPAEDNTVVVISSDKMGSGNDELGAVLIKGFIFALSQLEKLPKSVLFYNGGAKLTTEGSASLEDIKNMEAAGVEILTCGTCLNYYGLQDKLMAGSVTNMYTIVEKMTQASKIVRP